MQNNLCTPKNGEILVASTQDFLTSSFLITRKDTFYDRAAFSLMCSYIVDGMDPVDLPTPAILKVCAYYISVVLKYYIYKYIHMLQSQSLFPHPLPSPFLAQSALLCVSISYPV